jgi:hypothetical protein
VDSLIANQARADCDLFTLFSLRAYFSSIGNTNSSFPHISPPSTYTNLHDNTLFPALPLRCLVSSSSQGFSRTRHKTGKEKKLTVSPSVTPAETAQYSAIIDDILASSDLTTISAKHIRKGLQARLDEDISDKKVSSSLHSPLKAPSLLFLVQA